MWDSQAKKSTVQHVHLRAIINVRIITMYIQYCIISTSASSFQNHQHEHNITLLITLTAFRIKSASQHISVLTRSITKIIATLVTYLNHQHNKTHEFGNRLITKMQHSQINKSFINSNIGYISITNTIFDRAHIASTVKKASTSDSHHLPRGGFNITTCKAPTRLKNI